MTTDLVLTHGYFLCEDAVEQEIMRPYPPLGLLYLTSHLKAQGFSVDVFDSTFETPGRFESHLERSRPAVVGIYGNLMTRKNVLRAIRQARRVGAKVVLGGPEPANYAREYLERGADLVVEGEGEQTLEELLRHYHGDEPATLQEIRGLHFLDKSGELVSTEPRPASSALDKLPFPDRSAIDLAPYLDAWKAKHGQSSVSLITARGCPFRCRWCSHGVFGYGHRRRSPDNVADEIEEIVERYRPDLLWYADDVFTINRRWLLDFEQVLSRRKIRMPFETITREDRLDEEIVAALARMGCFRLWVGAESGSQTILDRMERRTDAARTRDMIRLLQSHGIEAGTFIMLGYEGETIEDIEETVAHLKAATPDRFLTTLSYPIKGTPYYQEIADRIVSVKPWEESSDRDLDVEGRGSKRFYRAATRWMIGEVALSKELRAGRYRAALRPWLNARLGRIGMSMFQRPPAASAPPR